MMFKSVREAGGCLTPSTTTTRFTLTIVIPLVLAGALLVAVAHKANRGPDIALAAEIAAALFEPGDLVVLYPETRFPDLAFFD